MRSFINRIVTILGRSLSWRLGRSLYLEARAESVNNAEFNGEQLLQKQLLSNFCNSEVALTIFDVGANIGDWTLSLLNEVSNHNMNRKVDIHSFEPVPTAYCVLQQRVNAHKLSNIVHLKQLALSKEEGVAEMYIAGETAGTNSLHPDGIEPNQTKIKVEKTTIYDYCQHNKISKLHYIKCDTEGHDVEVMYGAKKLFDQQKIMAFQFEYNHRWVYSRHFLKDVFDLIKDKFYRIGKLTPAGIEIYENWHPELEKFFEGNYIVLHPEATHWFTTISGEFDIFNTYIPQ